MATKYFFVLIHGTWGTESAWTKPDSTLRTVFEREFGAENCEFYRHKWSGANSQRGRKAAASELVRKISYLNKNFVGQKPKIFFVSHSHGGNIAVQANTQISRLRMKLAQSAKTRSEVNVYKREFPKIEGIVTFNTPFIYAQKRDFVGNYKFLSTIMKTLFFSLFSYFLFGLIGGVLNYIGGQGDFSSSIYNALAVGILLLVFFSVYQNFEDIIKRLARVGMVKSLRRNSVHYRTSARILGISSVGDEAYSYLSFLGQLVNLPFLFLHRIIIYFLLIFLTIISFYEINNHKLGLITNTTYEKCASGTSYFCQYITQIFDPVDKILLPNSTQFLGYVMNISVSIFVSVFITAALYLIMVAIALLSNALFNTIALGYPLTFRAILDVLYLKRGVDIIPYSIRGSEFVDVGIGGKILNHSVAYDDPTILRRVCTWIVRVSRERRST